MVVMVPLTILLIGPLSTAGANGIANGYNILAENVPALAGAIIGGFWQVLVIFGVHWGITPMVLANFEQYGRDSFQAYQTIAVIAQVGAVLGVILKARNRETRKVGVSAGITGLFELRSLRFTVLPYVLKSRLFSDVFLEQPVPSLPASSRLITLRMQVCLVR